MSQDRNLAWTHENLAYGINVYNGHGGLYGSMGGWYEWEPPLIYFRQPYARHWPAFVRHVARPPSSAPALHRSICLRARQPIRLV